MRITGTEPTSITKVKEVLEARAEAGEELGYEQENALEHASEFAHSTSKKTAELASKLRKEVPELEEEAAMKLAEVLPSTPELVQAILTYTKTELTEDQVSKIVELTKVK
ncbi:hypothetical protein GF415_04920 [Candidatus Micrarchaeota archaeon]|nr:hypothetical protein [Candidatus Micrarchaeota archaeon]